MTSCCIQCYQYETTDKFANENKQNVKDMTQKEKIIIAQGNSDLGNVPIIYTFSYDRKVKYINIVLNANQIICGKEEK